MKKYDQQAIIKGDCIRLVKILGRKGKTSKFFKAGFIGIRTSQYYVSLQLRKSERGRS
jgi:hypothetical protein